MAEESKASPLYDLDDALSRGERPPLAWVVRWSKAGRDPVVEAWAQQSTPGEMVSILEWCGCPERLAAAEAAEDAAYAAHEAAWPNCDLPRCVHRPSLRLEVCDAIRRAVPVPPTLAELLAARQR